MKITVAKSAGFCFGVKRAIDMALETAQHHKNIQMLGDIVHNEEVIQQIEKTGIKKVSRLQNGQNKTLLIRAHGASRQTITKASQLGYKIVDATCPMVKEIHKIAVKMERLGRRVIVIGDKKHEEVKGIVGQLKTPAVIIDSPKHIPLSTLKRFKKAAVITQSTQNIQNVLSVLDKLKKHIPDVKFFNTICGPTRIKQNEIRILPVSHDMVIVIGSRHSANTRRLYEISRSLNRHSFWIQNAKDIQKEWFDRKISSVAVTAGASTPQETIVAVLNRLRRFSTNPVH